MLSLLPQVLFLTPLAIAVIRITLGVLFLYAAWRQFPEKDVLTRIFAALEVVIAIALIVGFWTQAAALAALIVLLVWLFSPKRIYPVSTLLLALVMALSLVVTGPGAFAFDLPL